MPHPPTNVLVLGGTTEASALARALAAAGLQATLSYAGRVARPRAQPIPVRVGGFGGAEGMARYVRDHRVTHLVDATHPFAARISANAVTAAAMAGVPLMALVRPAWQPGATDRWANVPDVDAAVAALAGPPRRVMLAIGRQHIADFAARPQHFYLLRVVDPPEGPPPLPDHALVVDRGPFTTQGDLALMQAHRIDLLVAKNAGGQGAEGKIAAARALSLPVVMIDRPAIPARPEVASVAQVMGWIAHSADLGV